MTLRALVVRIQCSSAEARRRWLAVVLVLGLSRLAVMVLPYRWLAARLGRASASVPPQPLLSPEHERMAAVIGRTIGTVARRAPWGRNCFAQALTARFLLECRGIPSVLVLGVTRSQYGSLQAHAWTIAGTRYVTGGAGAQSHTVVGCFSGAGLRNVARS